MSVFEDDAPDVDRALRETARGIAGSGNAVVSGLKTLATGLLGGALGGALTMPLVLGFGALAIGTGALITAFKSATDEATKYSRALSSLRANQGLNFSQGFALTSRNSLFGIAPGETAQMLAAPGMNPIMAGLRARAMGFDSPYSPDAMANNARQYQSIAGSGPFGRLMANARLDAQYGGQAPDSVRQMMNLRPDQIQSQLAYGNSIQRAMRIRPTDLQKYGEEIPLARQRVSYAFDMAKVKLAVELAPLLERSLTTFATLIANNAPKIAQALEKFGHFMIQDFPPLLMRAGAWVARGLGNMLVAFGSFATGAAGNVRPILQVFDAILNGLRRFGAVAAGFGAALVQGAGTLYNALKQSGILALFRQVGSWMTGNPNSNQTNNLTNQIIGGGAAALGLRVLGGPIVRGLWGVGKWAAGAAWSAATGGGAAAGAGGATGAGAAGTGGLGAAAMAALPAAVIGGGGLLLGVGAYEAYRRTKWGQGMPSTYGIGKYLWAKHQGQSDADAARAAYGVPTSAQAAAQRAQQQQAARAARQAVAHPSSAFGYNPNLTVQQAFQNGQNAFLSNVGTSNLANNPALVGNLERMFGNAGSAATAGGQKLLGLADYLDKSADNYSKEMADQLRQIAATTREVARNTDKGAQSQADLLANFPDMMRQLVALTSSFIAQDAAYSLLGGN